MKVILINTLLLAVSLVQGEQPFWGDDDWFMLGSHAGGKPKDCDDYDVFCAMTEKEESKSGTSVVMGDDCRWDDTSGWRIWTAKDGNGFLLMLGNGNGYSGDKDALCMQVG